MDIRALFAEPFGFALVCAIQLDVVAQLARPAHAGIKGLLALRVAIATVGLQDMVAALG